MNSRWSKIIISFLVISLVIGYIIPLFGNYGIVRADIITNTKEGIEGQYNPNTEKACLIQHKAKMYIEWRGHVKVSGKVKESQLYKYQNGSKFTGYIDGKNGNDFVVQNFSAVKSGSTLKNLKLEKMYDVSFDLWGWIYTGYYWIDESGKMPSYGDYKVSYNDKSNGNSFSVTLSKDRKNTWLAEHEYRWVIVPKETPSSQVLSVAGISAGADEGYIVNSPSAQEVINNSNYVEYSYTPEPIGDSIVVDEPVVKDKYISVSNATKRAFIILLYRRVLNRSQNPAESEINCHMGGTMQQIAHNIIFSEEANTPQYNNEEFINKVYHYILQRGPDEEGFNYYMSLLNEPNRHVIVKSLVESVEFEEVLKHIGVHVPLTESSQKLFINGLYGRVLGREPTNDEMNAELKNYAQGNAYDIIFCVESKQKNNIDGMSNEEFVRFLYRTVLNRTDAEIEGDPEGFASNVRFLNNGNSRKILLNCFVESQEFTDKRNRETKEINLDNDLCNEVCNKLISQGYDVLKVNDNSIMMYNQDIEKVTFLDLSGKGLTSLNGLSNFPNLEKLVVQNNGLEDISDLSKLTNLKYLNLNGCGLGRKVTELSSLINLEELHLDNNKLSSYNMTRVIPSLTKLKKLYVNNNDLNNLAFTQNLESLKEIYADNNKISNVSIGNKVFDVISVKNNSISISSYGEEKDLPEIVQFAKTQGNMLYTEEDLALENCNVSDNKITMTEANGKITVKGGPADGTLVTLKDSKYIIILADRALAERLQAKLGDFAKNLRVAGGNYYLYVDKNYIDTVTNLDLSVKENDQGEITSIAGLEDFANLKTLNLNGNKVTNLNKLNKLKNLETLSIRFNGLTNLDSIKDLTNLRQLDASNNSLTDTTEIANLKNLETLLLSNNNIENNLNGIKTLENLTTLGIANNNVSNIQAISSLNIQNYYLSLNKISDLSGITSKENVNVIDLKNNTVDINNDGNTVNIPEIISYAMQNGGTDNLELINCKIVNNNIVIDDGSILAQIKVKNGNASDTLINIRNTQAINSFSVNIENQKNSDGSVTVTISSKTPMRYIPGWTRNVAKTKYTRTYYYNTKENITITSINGDEIVETIEVTNVTSNRIRGLSVQYDNYDITNGTVTVIITADEPIYLPDIWIGEGVTRWQVSEDHKTITKVFSSNGIGTLPLISMAKRSEIASLIDMYERGIITEDEYRETYEEYNEKYYVQFNRYVATIDTQAPECDEIEYSTKDKTKGSVRVTIWSDEDIELVNKDRMYANVLSTYEDGDTKYGISLYYPENTTENLEIQDAAGNKTTVTIQVDNIDKYVEGLDVNTLGMTATNLNETVVVKANEKINIKNDGNSVISKTRELYNNALIPMFTIAGRTNTIPVMSSESNSINSSALVYLSDTDSNSVVNGNQNNITTNEDGNELSIEIGEGTRDVVNVIDETNNTDVAPYNTSNIDKIPPVVSRKDTKNDDGTKLVTLSVNEEIQDTEDLSGWTLSEDKKSLTKRFELNGLERIIVKDLAGNETEYSLEINDIHTLNLVTYYERIDSSNRWLVVIKADKELKEIDGWEYLENRNEIAKVFTVNEKETVILNSVDNKSAVAEIEVIDFSNNYVEETTEDNNQEEENKTVVDNTQSDKELPATGVYMMFTLIMSIALVIATAITIIDYKKKFSE